jgi:outer membrane protein OmpA-like peptidoglycan-associated protein
MMKKLILASAITLILVGCAGDTDEYIPTPVANQQADLRDDDSDGVINARDRCSQTPEGAELTNDGCEEYIEITEQQALKVLFNNDSYEVSPIFAGHIEQMALFLAQYPETSVEIQGFASNPGSVDYNLELSRNRALSVQDKIISYGVDPSRVTIIGYGEDDIEEGSVVDEALERRVEATVVGLKGDYIKEWTVFSSIAK